MDHLQVVCGVIIKNEKIMICRRGALKSNAGKWEFPGGKIETFEDPLHALRRELTEELQLTAENY